MASPPSDWTIPAPLRALVWWPGTAFVLVLVAPEAAAASIALAGLALVAVGAALDTIGARLRTRRALDSPDLQLESSARA